MNRLIEHVDAIATYVPPGHAGTVNRRLVTRHSCERFELVLGRVEPGGRAARHRHHTEYQAMYIVRGEADVTLDDGPTERCGPGTIVRIPAGTEHEVISVGDDTLEVLLVYSPPLIRGD